MSIGTVHMCYKMHIHILINFSRHVIMKKFQILRDINNMKSFLIEHKMNQSRAVRTIRNKHLSKKRYIYILYNPRYHSYIVLK